MHATVLESTGTHRPGTGAASGRVPPEELPRGVALLHDPEFNKGTAFSQEERETLHLRGLLPPRILTEDTQVARALEILEHKPTDLERYIYLISLQDRNETLFFRVVMDHLRKLMPIVYTPTVGQACEQYGHIFRRPRGLWVSADDRGHIAEVLRNWPHADEVRIIVVTDGERILGLGDLGADGMGIPVGKLTLYTACAGIPPVQCLPVTLDVGTNNSGLLRDPLYIGLPRTRLTGDDYDTLVDEFMSAAHERFPKAVIQLEDFANHNAFRLLNRYRNAYCLFDDDIQGTGSVILGGLLASQRLAGVALREQRLLFLGAGEAAIGISDLITSALVLGGMDEAEARTHCWVFDSQGLVVRGREHLAVFKKPYAHDHPPVADFLAAVHTLKPTGIIGASGQPGRFTQPVIEAMARMNERPVIFALSNPTSKSECTAAQAYEWSEGRAIFASGSPYQPVEYGGRRLLPGQGNNAYVFPGIGLGAVVSETSRMTDEMFLAAAQALADEVTDEDINAGRLFPAIERIRDVSVQIAAAVCRVAYLRGLARAPEPPSLLEHLKATMFDPSYRTYV